MVGVLSCATLNKSQIILAIWFVKTSIKLMIEINQKSCKTEIKLCIFNKRFFIYAKILSIIKYYSANK